MSSYDEYDLDEATAAVAAHMVKEDEVGELVCELYSAASDTLAALSAIQRPSYAVVTLMQRLRLVIKQVETEGEQQIADRRAESLEMRAHYAEAARDAAL